MVNKCSPWSALTCQRVANDEETNAYEDWPALVEIAGCFPAALSWWPSTSEGLFPRLEEKVSAAITGCTNKANDTWLLKYYSTLSLRVLCCSCFFVLFWGFLSPSDSRRWSIIYYLPFREKQVTSASARCPLLYRLSRSLKRVFLSLFLPHCIVSTTALL